MVEGRKLTRDDYRLFPKGFWVSPERHRAPDGDRRKERIYLAVGRALSEWERTEEVLVGLYHIFCGTWGLRLDIRNAVERAFGAIGSTSGRLAAMEAAAEAYFGKYWTSQEVRWPFDALRDSIQAAAHIRNNIAHGIVRSPTSTTGNADGTQSARRYGSFLMAPKYATGRNDLDTSYNPDNILSDFTSKYVYTSKDIFDFCEKFKQLGEKYLEFCGKILCLIEEPQLVKDAIEAERARAAQKEEERLRKSRQPRSPPKRD